ncbi:MAG TPA: HAD family hydrolase [Chloroflexota bacterium]|jgi:FMN phosphatase YigB (HAD superfamily)|nr:HAD family hydrolase [Chloroflexota bacterium]
MASVVSLLDVDNTLLDNDRVTDDLRRFLNEDVSADAARQYFELFEELREELGYADYLGALQRFRDKHPRELRVLRASHFLIDYPFANRLFPESLDAIATLKELGHVAILSDGDVVFQPRKIERSGLWSAVDGEVLIYVHKEQVLEDVERRLPADHYIVVDDKLRVLDQIKKVWRDRVTTIFPRQGHYARDPGILTAYPPADVTVDHIGDVTRLDLPSLFASRGSLR